MTFNIIFRYLDEHSEWFGEMYYVTDGVSRSHWEIANSVEIRNEVMKIVKTSEIMEIKCRALITNRFRSIKLHYNPLQLYC